jgi:hypothetical protein
MQEDAEIQHYDIDIGAGMRRNIEVNLRHFKKNRNVLLALTFSVSEMVLIVKRPRRITR